jgi:uncharacterized membrane protein HdeD (DUF308 family)
MATVEADSGVRHQDFGWAGQDPVMDAMSATLAQNWWVIALRGVFAILFGIIALLLPGVAIASLVLLFAAYMLLDGGLAIISGVRAARQDKRWGWLVFEGIVDILAGIVAFVSPLITVLFFVCLMGAWAIVSGSLLTTAAFQLHVVHGRWLMVLGGIISVIWGIMLILWPFVGALVLTWWMGAYALFFGGALIALAFRLRKHRHELPSGGAISQAA